MYTKILIACLALCLAHFSNAQQKATLRGVVTDKEQEALYGANILVKDFGGNIVTGVVSEFNVEEDKEGFYKLEIAPGTYRIEVSCIAYASFKTDTLILKEGEIRTLNFQLEENDLNADGCLMMASVQNTSGRNAKMRPRKKSIPNYKNHSTTQPKPKRVKGGIPKDSISTEDEEYEKIVENEYVITEKENTSTFSIDVDRASYSNVRRYLQQLDELPPPNAVRIEEMVNYFEYEKYEQAADNHPFTMHTELSDCPWNKEAKLLMLTMQARQIDLNSAPAQNLVFLIDVSGSMSYDNKLSLVKESLKLLINNLRDQDKVAMVVYAGAAGLVLPATNDKTKMLEALDKLEAGGSTAGSEGILLAYQTAKENFIKGGNNRIILATDGDFNVGISSNRELKKLIEKKRNEGIFLTVLGYGMGNYKDHKMEILANKGNGNYAYIDNLKEAKKMLIKEVDGTLYTLAKDVKLQLVFDSKYVSSYRLVGYENRLLNKKDFNNDKKDAGELGAGHTVTAFYEVVLAPNVPNESSLVNVKMRYKQPNGTKSTLMEQTVNQKDMVTIEHTSENFRFASAVAGFGMLLRQSKFQKELTYDQLLAQAKAARGEDKEGYRIECINLIEQAKTLTNKALKINK